MNDRSQAYEKGMEYFGEDNIQDQLLISFAMFEERQVYGSAGGYGSRSITDSQKEHDRARVIYRYGLDNLPADKVYCIERVTVAGYYGSI